jgi:ubiquitin-conjugating enzyme E2 J2
VLLFPSEYPFKPPGIKMFTPSGRFQPDKKICFSMSDFHPGSWNPAWSVATILTGLLSFMLSDEMTAGSVTSSESHKRAFAARSHSWNLAQPRFQDVFPDFCTPELRDLPNMGEKERGPVEPVVVPTPTISAPSPSTTVTQPQTSPPTSHNSSISSTGKPEDTINTTGWTSTWRHLIWEKWRWGVLIALAVLVSRFSSTT